MPQPITDPVYNIRARRYEGTQAGLADTDEEAAARTLAIAQTEANDLTLRERAELALAQNDQIIADGVAWLAANTGTLTTAQLSNAMRGVMDASVKAARQRSTLIRLTLRKFDSVQGTAGAGGR